MDFGFGDILRPRNGVDMRLLFLCPGGMLPRSDETMHFMGIVVRSSIDGYPVGYRYCGTKIFWEVDDAWPTSR